MKPLALLVLALLFAAPATQASVASARQARAALGPDIWARVLRVENHNPRSRYPRTVYATVFEFAGLLWFYTDADGTQSFSLHRGMLEEEKADFRPLLRDIEPGFSSFEVLPDTDAQAATTSAELPNGCFINSVAALRVSLERGEQMKGAALLSYFVEVAGHLCGHTVLAYETSSGLQVVDCAQGRRPLPVGRGSLASEPLKIARALAPRDVVRASWVPVPLAAANPAVSYAAVDLPVSRGDGAVGAVLTVQ